MVLVGMAVDCPTGRVYKMALGECNDWKCGAVDAVRPRGLVALVGDRACGS